MSLFPYVTLCPFIAFPNVATYGNMSPSHPADIYWHIRTYSDIFVRYFCMSYVIIFGMSLLEDDPSNDDMQILVKTWPTHTHTHTNRQNENKRQPRFSIWPPPVCRGHCLTVPKKYCLLLKDKVYSVFKFITKH